jgi:tripeptidyl-peptidase I
MVASSLFFSLVSVVSLACAKGTDNLVVHERRDSIPEDFVRNGTAPQDEVLHLRMGLRSNNITGLETILYDVSDPHSKNYGNT